MTKIKGELLYIKRYARIKKRSNQVIIELPPNEIEKLELLDKEVHVELYDLIDKP